MADKAIILGSGGLDSSVLAYWIKKKEKIPEIEILFFDYNQKCLKEEKFCVENLAQKLDAKLTIIEIPWLGKISTSLINKEKENKNKKTNEIENWYVPCRNTIFLIIALAHAESEFIKTGKKSEIYIGIKYEGDLRFNDTTAEFIDKINNLSKNATQFGKYNIKAPFLKKDKEELIELGKELGVDLNLTYSCYLGGGFKNGLPVHCGKCAGCLARKKGFKFSKIYSTSYNTES